MVDNLLSGAHAFIFKFHLLGNQFLKFLEVHVLKILNFAMTLAATVARRRNTPGRLVL
jgi:hypothetical protein